jgi:hypothetical protein
MSVVYAQGTFECRDRTIRDVDGTADTCFRFMPIVFPDVLCSTHFRQDHEFCFFVQGRRDMEGGVDGRSRLMTRCVSRRIKSSFNLATTLVSQLQQETSQTNIKYSASNSYPFRRPRNRRLSMKRKRTSPKSLPNTAPSSPEIVIP